VLLGWDAEASSAHQALTVLESPWAACQTRGAERGVIKDSEECCRGLPFTSQTMPERHGCLLIRVIQQRANAPAAMLAETAMRIEIEKVIVRSEKHA